MVKSQTKPAKGSSRISMDDLMDAVGITSIAELSEQSSVSLRTIYNCRYSKHVPNNGTVYLLAVALDTDSKTIRSAIADLE